MKAANAYKALPPTDSIENFALLRGAQAFRQPLLGRFMVGHFLMWPTRQNGWAMWNLPYQSEILATTPAPTVRPPSRMAKRSFSSMAIG